MSVPRLPFGTSWSGGAEIEHDVVRDVHLIRQLWILLTGHSLGLGLGDGFVVSPHRGCSFLSGASARISSSIPCPQYLANVCVSFGSRSACWAASELEQPGPSAPQLRQRAWQPNSVNTTVIEQRRWSHPARKLGLQFVRDLSTEAILLPPF
jgi:hypothetical protein